jgi:PBSX family phage portal protein
MAKTNSRQSAARQSKSSRPAGAKLHLVRSITKADETGLVQAMKDFSNRQIDDPFNKNADLGGSLSVITPPFNPNALLKLPHENNTLLQCIEAMVTNCEGHGWKLEYVGPEGKRESVEAKAEKNRVEGFLLYPNDDHSLQEARERVRRDIETVGYGYYEIGRDNAGMAIMLAHTPANTLRMTTKDRTAIDVDVLAFRDGKFVKVKIKKRFRRFVQQVGGKTIYFKEFGDPRRIDPATGKEKKDMPVEEAATEIYMQTRYSPGHAYGLPRWINQLPGILGSREAELTNLSFFRENAIPAMALLVSGGMVTTSSIEQIEGHFVAARGRESMHRILVIEAQGDEDAATPEGNIPAPKLELKPLQGERQKDALFQAYDANNADKVRSSFRLPPIFIGLSQDYTYATAKTSFEVAESQVFAPERRKSDEIINMRVLANYGLKYWRFVSLPPRITDPTEVSNAMTVFNNVGAMTPNIAIGLANNYFNLQIEPIAEAWGDYPFVIVQALAASGRLIGIEEIDAGIESILGLVDAAGGSSTEEDDEKGDPRARAYSLIRKNLLQLRHTIHGTKGE